MDKLTGLWLVELVPRCCITYASLYMSFVPPQNIKAHENRKQIFSANAARENPFKQPARTLTEPPPWSSSSNAPGSSQPPAWVSSFSPLYRKTLAYFLYSKEKVECWCSCFSKTYVLLKFINCTKLYAYWCISPHLKCMDKGFHMDLR